MQDEYVANFPIEMLQRHSVDLIAPQSLCQMIEFVMPDRSVTRREANQILGAAAATPLLAAQSPVLAAQSPDICFFSAGDMAEMIRRKKLSAREVMAAHLKQIDRVNPKVNAIVTLVAKQATENA